MKILIFNSNRFDGNYTWCDKKQDIEKNERLENLKKIKEQLVETVKSKDDIGVITEFPIRSFPLFCREFVFQKWKKFLTNDTNLKLLSIYEDAGDACKCLPTTAWNCVVAVVIADSSWKLISQGSYFGETNGKRNYINRYLQLENSSRDLRFLAIHVNEDMKSKIIQNHEILNQDILAGDFNDQKLLYEYLKKEGYVQTNDKKTFCNSTAIDNVFIGKKLELIKADIIEVPSDHKGLLAEIKINNKYVLMKFLRTMSDIYSAYTHIVERKNIRLSIFNNGIERYGEDCDTALLLKLFKKIRSETNDSKLVAEADCVEKMLKMYLYSNDNSNDIENVLYSYYNRYLVMLNEMCKE